MVYKIVMALVLVLVFVFGTHADEPLDAENRALIDARLRALELPVIEVKPVELPGFYEVVLDGNQSLYITQDGRHFLTGDLYRMIPGLPLVNVTEQGRNQHRRALIDAVHESEMVVFSPPAEEVKATVNVFTDVDCGWCQKFHREVPELNRLGISVRYLAYPRAGVDSKSYDKIVSAWCSDERQEALTLAKLGEEIEQRTCENPVAAHYRLGREVGVNGTPSLVLGNGRLVPGYLPADKLAQQLGVIN